MCYLCSTCNAVVGPKVSLIRHVISRTVPMTYPYVGERSEIERELSVCSICAGLLRAGRSPIEVAALARKSPAEVPQPLAPEPPLPPAYVAPAEINTIRPVEL